jgi:hypothetical protein
MINNTSRVAVINPTESVDAEALTRLLRTEVGTSMRGTVRAVFKDQSFAVDVRGALLRMQLPAGTPLNTVIGLKLLTTQPTLTFALSNFSSLALQTGLPDSSLSLSLRTVGISDAVEISDIGKLVSDLLDARAASGQSTDVIGKVPVSAVSGAAVKQLAEGLKNTLDFSGLFYESHVKQWATQGRPIELLQREPQMQTNLMSAPSSSFSIVPLQLNTLEQQKIAWTGEAWPGQPMRWEVQRGMSQSEEGGVPVEQKSWESTVTFNLPSLGAVQAKIYLRDGYVSMALSAQDETTAATLRMSGSLLEKALGASGTELEALSVSIRSNVVNTAP